MELDDELEQWLREQPLDEPVELDGEIVYLEVRPAGAVLGAHLTPFFTRVQLQDAMKQGFHCAVMFESGAGLGQSADGNALVLSRWLPDARDWTDAAEALEDLLNQLATWRERLAPKEPARIRSASRIDQNEQRLRMLFAGEK